MLHFRTAQSGLMAVMLITLLTLGLLPAAAPSAEAQGGLRVAMIVAEGGLGDSGYNDAAFDGLTAAISDFGVLALPIEAQNSVIDEADELLYEAAESGFDVIITLESRHAESVDLLAPDYPDQIFVIFNAEVDQPNVVSVLFADHVNGFVAGALAATLTERSGPAPLNSQLVVGAVGGEITFEVENLWFGYAQGFCHIQPEGELLLGFSDGFADVGGAQDLAAQMIEAGVDVIFSAARLADEGVLAAAQEAAPGAWVITMDGLNMRSSGQVIATMQRPVADAVYGVVAGAVDGVLLSARGDNVLVYPPAVAVLVPASDADMQGFMDSLPRLLASTEDDPGMVLDAFDMPNNLLGSDVLEVESLPCDALNSRMGR